MANKLSCIILSGRFDEKICYKTSKSLLTDSCGVSLIERQIITLTKELLEPEIIIVTTNNTDRIYKKLKGYNAHIVENQLFDITNEVEDLRLGLLNATTDNYLILNSNIVMPNLQGEVLGGNPSWVSYGNESSGRQKAGLNIIDNDIQYFSFDMPFKYNNLAYFCGKESKALRNMCFDKKKNTKFIFEILNDMLEEKANFKPILQYVPSINSSKDMEDNF